MPWCIADFLNSVIHSWLLLEKETQSEACSNIGAPVWRTDGLSEPSCEDPGPVRPDSRQWTLNKSRVNITSVDLRHLKWCEATKRGDDNANVVLQQQGPFLILNIAATPKWAERQPESDFYCDVSTRGDTWDSGGLGGERLSRYAATVLP